MTTRDNPIILFLAAVLVSVAFAAPSHAQSPTALGKFNDWTAWSYAGSKGKVCYIHATPQELRPDSLRHGDVSFFVRTSPAEGVKVEANFVVGYSFEDNSTVSVDVDGRKFTMFTQGDSAWLLDPSEEPALLAAMKAGSKMTISGRSRRGNSTTYAYSLSGVTAASNKITAECG